MIEPCIPLCVVLAAIVVAPGVLTHGVAWWSMRGMARARYGRRVAILYVLRKFAGGCQWVTIFGFMALGTGAAKRWLTPCGDLADIGAEWLATMGLPGPVIRRVLIGVVGGLLFVGAMLFTASLPCSCSVKACSCMSFLRASGRP